MLKNHELEEQVRSFINEKINDVIYLTVDFDKNVEETHTTVFYTVTVKSRYPMTALKNLFALEDEGLLVGDDFERTLTFQLTENGLDAIHGMFGWCGHNSTNTWEVDFEQSYILFEID